MIVIIFLLVPSILGTPFIIDESHQSIEYCTYVLVAISASRKYIETNSTTDSLKTTQEQIFFKLCGKFSRNDKCPEGSVGCSKDHKSETKVNFGTHFKLAETGDLLVSQNGSKCTANETYTLFVHLESESNHPIFHSKTKNNCSYHIKAPLYPKTSKCGVAIYGRYFDLSPLAGTYITNGKESQYKVTLCDSKTACGKSGVVNACKITGNNSQEELSMTDSVNIFYIGAKSEIAFRGSFRKDKNTKVTRKLEVILKCDWDKKFIDKQKDLKYVEKQTQGKLHTFELETSFGCIKKPISCKLQHEFLIFDLSSLNNKKVWSTRHEDDIYFLQLCKPIELSGTNVTCKGTYAQVCRNSNGRDLNMGSVLTHLEPNGDSLRATLDRGGRCQEGIQYKSVIDLRCGRESGPQFDHGGDSCTSHFRWTTPAACPKYNTESCSHIHPESHKCTFTLNYNVYNLKALTTQTIEDHDKPEIVYKFNVCGPVIDHDAPCMKDVSVIMKNNSEMNVLDKVKSLGKFHDSFLRDEVLILEFATGAFCDERVDYKSEIRMECSDIDDKPQLLAQEHCFFHFVWKTKHACPQLSKELDVLDNLNSQSCLLKDHETSEIIDLAHPKLIEVGGEKFKYIFSVCGEFYSNCSLETKDCINIQSNTKELTTSASSATLDLTYSRSCNETSSGNFNVVIINFVCNSIENNDHFQSWDIQGCELRLSYGTAAVCSIKGRKQELALEAVQSENCTIQSPFTGYGLDLQNVTTISKSNRVNSITSGGDLSLRVYSRISRRPFLKKNCPDVKYNSTFQFVQLMYHSEDKCTSLPINNVSYELVLVCPNSLVPLSQMITDEDCNIRLSYQQSEYCNFFKSLPEPTNYYLVLGITVPLLAVMVLSVGAAIAFRKGKCNNFNRLDTECQAFYQRDAEL